MSNIQSSTTTPFIPASSYQMNEPDSKVESAVITQSLISSSETSALKNTLARADALRHILVGADILIRDQTIKSLELRVQGPIIYKPLSIQMQTFRDEREITTQQFANNLRGIANNDNTLTAQQNRELQAGITSVFNDASPIVHSLFSMSTPKKTIEDKELWEKAANAIKQIGEEYLGVYEDAVGKYTDFFKAFTNITSQMGAWITPGADGNKLKLDIGSLINALRTLKTSYSLPNQGAVLFPSQGSSTVTGATKSQAEQWASELGLPGTSVKSLADGKYVVVIDSTPIDNMIRDLNNLGTGVKELDNSKFQAWQAGFKAQEENMKNTLQTLTQKYSNANSLYDNLVKVLSSTISSCLETAKSFLNG